MEIITTAEAKEYLAIESNVNITDDNIRIQVDSANSEVTNAIRKRYTLPLLNYSDSEAEKLLKGVTVELSAVKIIMQLFRGEEMEDITNTTERLKIINEKLQRISGAMTPTIDLYDSNGNEMPINETGDEVGAISGGFGDHDQSNSSKMGYNY